MYNLNDIFPRLNGVSVLFCSIYSFIGLFLLGEEGKFDGVVLSSWLDYCYLDCCDSGKHAKMKDGPLRFEERDRSLHLLAGVLRKKSQYRNRSSFSVDGNKSFVIFPVIISRKDTQV